VPAGICFVSPAREPILLIGMTHPHHCAHHVQRSGMNAMSGRFGFSWSWKRAIGLTAAKSRISREIGIPLTRAGRERKVGAWLLGDSSRKHTSHFHRHKTHIAWGLILTLAALFVYSNFRTDQPPEQSTATRPTHTSATR
jgi:hypothetical protein